VAKNSWLGDPLRSQSNSVDPSDGRQRTYGSAGRDGGRHIASGPQPGARSGVSRSDGPSGRATGTAADLTGPPRAPRR
jgi:hypothetical protein